MYDLPMNFTYGVIEQHRVVRGGEKPDDVPGLNPGHHHMHEWYLFSDLTRPDTQRVGSPTVRVFNPAFSSLSLNVNSGRTGSGYTQERLVAWLEGQEWWRRNNGRDHVIVAGDPNALKRVMDRVKKAVLLVGDLGRLRADQGSLVKDVSIPCSHRIDVYEGMLGRDLLFKLLENEDDVVIIKHGTRSTENRRAAKEAMHTSKFCLHPGGDTPPACRLFDYIGSLCIPVTVSDGVELTFRRCYRLQKFLCILEE
ncbi:hypothetical protein YC2023_024521 [Brassica napus]